MKDSMSKKTLQLLSLAVLIPLAVGCRPGGGSAPSKEEQKKAAALKFPIMTDLTTLDPPMIQDHPTHQVLEQIYEGLVHYDENNKIQPLLAEKWEVSKDGKTYTFYLKKGVKFHNGKEFTAEDVKWSFERASDPKMKSPTVENFLNDVVGFKERIEGKAKELSGVHIKDPHTVQITVTQPKSYFIAKLGYAALWIVPKDEKLSTEIVDVKNAVGTGPFKLKEYHPHQLIVLEAFENYHTGKPLLSRVEIPIVKDLITAVNGFKAGKYHFVAIPALEVSAIKKDPTYKDQLKEYETATINYLELNGGVYKPFADPRVRRAFAMAIDRDKLANETLGGNVEPAKGMVPKGVPGYRPDAKSPEFNPEKARALLAEAGYPDPSKMPPVNLNVSLTEGAQAVKASFDAIVLQMRKNLGVSAKVVPVEWGTMLARLKKRDVPFRFGGWAADYIDPANFLTDLLSTKAASNNVNYSNPHFDKLTQQADTAQKLEDRLALYAQAEDIMLQDAPAIPLFYRKDFYLVRKDVKGLRRNLLGFMTHNQVTFGE
jgi:ABC-type transport system substrate-binding protein